MANNPAAKSNRRYPSLREPGNTIESHSDLLRSMREAIEIHERRTPDIRASFISVGELVDLGILEVKGGKLLLGRAFDSE